MNNTWTDYPWPSWIPPKIREQIESFWAVDWGRGPKAWIDNCRDRYSGHPPIGTLVTCQSIGGRETFRGRWVPAWNNMGRVVLADGTFGYSSTCALKVVDLGWGASLRGFPVNGTENHG